MPPPPPKKKIHRNIWTAIISASDILELLNDIKNISDVTKMHQQCDVLLMRFSAKNALSMDTDTDNCFRP